MIDLPNFLRSFDGPLSRSLERTNGAFALGQIPANIPVRSTTTSVCGYCSTGCGLNIHLGPEGAVSLTPDPTYPVNRGTACPKGWEALTVLDAPDRGTVPLLLDRKSGKRSEISWARAIGIMVEKFSDLREREGAESAAFLSTGQIPTEEMFLLGSLWKFGLGFLHADSNTRQCMATAHVAYKQSFGYDAPPFCYEDFEESDVLVFVGANPCIAHPILWERVMRNKRHPLIVVVDPRMTETAQTAGLHVQLAPKSDLALLYAVLREVLDRGWVDRAFVEASTTGFEALREFLVSIDVEATRTSAGISVEVFEAFVQCFRPGRRVSCWWTMGVNQSHEAVRTAQALISLCLVTGNIGKPGTGPNSITGQANAMGSRLYSNTSSLVGGRDFQNPGHRAEVARILGLDESSIPTSSGMAYDQILDSAVDGKIKALWVVATNPAHTWIGSGTFQRVREKLEFLVVQDMYWNTETAQMADLYLPAAGWGEKEGTQINSERRIGLTKRVKRPPGQAMADFEIFRLVGMASGLGEWFGRLSSPEAAFGLMKDLSKGRPHDFTGIKGYVHVDAAGGIQWPYPEGGFADTRTQLPRDGLPPEFRSVVSGDEGGRRLFGSGKFFTADGKAKFLFDPPRAPEEPTDGTYDLVLMTGRGASSQWHTLSRTNKSAVLRNLSPTELLLQMNPQDAARAGIHSGEMVRVASRRGRLRVRLVATDHLRPGTVFLPMHDPRVNILTFPSFDPYSRQPSYKHAAVRVEKG